MTRESDFAQFLTLLYAYFFRHTMPYAHVVQAVSDPGDAAGFAYTVGLHAQGKAELFAMAVPVGLIPEVARIMNGLSERSVRPHDAVTADGANGELVRYRLRPPRNLAKLKRTHLLGIHRAAEALEFVPDAGWPEATGPCVGRSASWTAVPN